ncbi:MAG: hypothetical protein ACXVAW_08455 [Vulcanimicrobiaceae bacterium]
MLFGVFAQRFERRKARVDVAKNAGRPARIGDWGATHQSPPDAAERTRDLLNIPHRAWQ